MEKINFCLKCGHKWIQRGKRPPKVCSRCKNPSWNKRSNDDLVGLITG